jgi:hypothetical protein
MHFQNAVSGIAIYERSIILQLEFGLTGGDTNRGDFQDGCVHEKWSCKHPATGIPLNFQHFQQYSCKKPKATSGPYILCSKGTA